MAIPEAQFDTWAKQGAVSQSRDTYAAVKRVLENSGSPYYLKTFESFLQGSYANNTNVYRDSDVDIVMCLDSAWHHDIPTLPSDQQAAFRKAYPETATYGLTEFKVEVAGWLKKHFGDRVAVGSKAIYIPADGARRDCDVLPCARFRYYYRFNSEADQRYIEGICFFLKDGTRIVNFPKQHSANSTAKHQATSQWFKPTVRIYKNMRNYLVDHNAMRDGLAPSYFVEGLLYNVPADKFGASYVDTFTNTFDYLVSTDRSAFTCANGIHPLLRAGSHVSWSPSDCQLFLNALRKFWNNWPSV